jgi:hypothetical protein
MHHVKALLMRHILRGYGPGRIIDRENRAACPPVMKKEPPSTDGGPKMKIIYSVK